MSDKYDNTNSGALFKNDKAGVETRPDYNGMLNVAGEDYWISGWIKEGKSGKFLSLAVKPKEAKKAAPKGRQAGDDFGEEDKFPF